MRPSSRSGRVAVPLRWAWRVVMWCVLVVLLGTVAVAVVVPRLAGATPYTVLTGSMRPDLPPGTLVVVRPVDARDLRVGDVVTVQLRSGEDAVVTHRVSALSTGLDGEPRIQTRGDANPVPDAELRRPEQVRGRLWYAVPWVGRVGAALAWAHSRPVLQVVAAGLAGYALLMLAGAWRDRRGRGGPGAGSTGTGPRRRAGAGRARTVADVPLGRHRASTPTSRRVRFGRTPVVLGVALVLGLGTSGTYAAWTDTAAITGGTLTSGTMDLQLDTNGAQGLAAGYTRSDIAWSGFVPGETKAFALSVRNVGTPSFTYTAAARTSPSTAWTFAASAVTVRLYAGSVSGSTCSGTALGPAVALTGTAQATTTSARTLAGNGPADALCLELGLSSAATSANQGKSGVVELDLTATQVLP